MERIFEFIGNHWELVSLLAALIGGLVYIEGRRAGETVTALQVTKLINQENAMVLDLRDKSDFDQGHITGALHYPYKTFKEKLSELAKHKGRPIILVCQMGQHSSAAGKWLREDGFESVSRLSGGISNWVAEQLPLVKK